MDRPVTRDQLTAALLGALRRHGIANAQAAVPTLLRSLDADGIRVAGLTMREPSLDDVFMRYTGRHIRAEEADRPLDLGWWG